VRALNDLAHQLADRTDARDARSDDRSEQVEALATACGYALGAALKCHSIAEERLLAAADRIVEMLRRFDDGTRKHCVAAFKEALADGKASVDSGEIDESTAENTLRRIERILGR
jgi:hypothetical protein